MVEQLTLYTAKVCPFAHRTEIALAEAKAEFKTFEVDLRNKPEWYAPKVNPASKVPAIAYGGPDVAPEDPSPESVKIAESLILVEFIADLFPHSGLLPTDPVQRAKARFFIDAVSTKFVPAYMAYTKSGESPSGLVEAATALEKLIIGKYALGDHFTAADASIAPFILRSEVALEVKGGEDGLSQLQQRTPRFWQYYQDLKAHPSVARTFDRDVIQRNYKLRFASGK